MKSRIFRAKCLKDLFGAGCFCVLVCAVASASINRGTIQGTVTDPGGAASPGVTVIVTDTDTGESQTSKTNGAGFYFVPELVPGNYRVHFEQSGFVTIDVTQVVVQANQTTQVDRTLELGKTLQRVSVTAAPPAIETDAENFSVSIDPTYMESLPLLGRDIQSFVQLIPGATQTSGPPGTLVGFDSAFGGFPDATHTVGSYVAVNGGQGGANLWYLDGNLNAAQGTDNVVVSPTPDAVGEFQAVTNGFAAEYGRNAGAVFNVVLKSGTNMLHGDVYEYNRNSLFSARNPFAQLDAQGNELFHRFVNWNQFGGTIGGPIVLPHIYNGKNRTFFFAAWDISLLHEKVPNIYTVPTALERNNDFSDNPNIAQYGIYDPMTTTYDSTTGLYVRQPFLNANGTLATSIPANRLDPVAQFYLNSYPMPNYLDPLQQNAATGGCLSLCDNFRGQEGASQTTHNVSIKVDHEINQKHKLFVEWLFNPTYYTNFRLPWTGATAQVQGISGTNPYRVNNEIAALGETFTLSPTLVNEVRVMYARQAIIPRPNPDSEVNNSGVLKEIQGLNIPVGNFVPVPTVSIGGIGAFGPVPGGWSSGLEMTDNYALLDNLTKVLAKHTLKTGFIFRDDRTAYEYNYPTGLTFNGALTANAVTGVGGSGLAQFMLGAVAQGSGGGYYHDPYTSNHTWGFYVQDDYRLTKNFSLNLGLRYDIYEWIKEKNNAASVFDFTAPNPLIPTRLGAVLYLGTSSRPGNLLFPANKTDFGPRINFAYSPFGSHKTVIRGGIDLVYTNGMTQLFGQQQGGGQYPGFSQAVEWLTDATGQGLVGFYETPAFILNKGAPTLGIPSNPKTQNFQGLFNTLYSPEKNQYDPNVGIWNLQVQRQLPGDAMISVGYVGSKGTHLLGDEYRNFSYVHTADIQQYRLQLNSPVSTPADLVPFEGATVPLSSTLVAFPQYPYGVYDVLNGDGNSFYNGLQLKVEKRYSHGMNLIVAYAYQKTIGSADLGGYTANSVYPSQVYGSARGRNNSLPGGDGIGGGAQNPDDRQADRSLSADDIPQVLNIAGSYELPFGPGKLLGSQTKSWRAKLIEGWKLAPNFNIQSGVPLTISGPCDNLQSTIASENYWAGPCRPDLIGSPSAGRSGKSRPQLEQQWFNPNAFSAAYGSDPNLIYALTNGVYPDGTAFNPSSVNALWQFGTAGTHLGNARSPAFWGLDMSLMKDFRISESKYFQFRWELYNALNHQNLAIPSTGWCLPPNADGSTDVIHQFGCQFGRITNVQTDPRNMQFALKLFF